MLQLGTVRRVALLTLSIAVSACVIGRSSRPTQIESAQGPLAPPVTGAPVVPQTLAEDSDAPPGPGKPGAVWVRGYWHWDGVKHVWVRGRWQMTAPTQSADH